MRRLALALCLVFAGQVEKAVAGNLRWDADPATAGLQDAGGFWINSSGLTNWWDGTKNVAWIPGSIAVVGSNLTGNATITLSNSIVAGGLILSNNISYTNGPGVPVFTFNGSPGSSGTNLTLTGSPALLLHAANYSNTPAGASGNETFNVSLVAPGGLRLSAMSPWVTQASFNNTTNYIAGTLEVGTPGNASYTSPTAMLAQFNSSGIGGGALSGCTNLTVYTNCGILFRGGSGAFTLNWPKKFILSGDGIPKSSFCFGALLFGGNNGSVFPADIVLAGDTSIAGAWGDASVTITNSGTISGSGRLRFGNSANRAGSSTVVFTGVHTYVGDTILDGRITVRLASGADNRLPAGTHLKLGTAGAFYAPNSAGVPQSGWNGYGRMILGDTVGAMNQTLAGLTNEPALSSGSTGCFIVGGNPNDISTITVNCDNDWTYNAALGGAFAPDSSLALIKAGSGTLHLQGNNQCRGGYTIQNGGLVFGDGITDNILSGPITNSSTLTINVALTLGFADGITGSGSFIKNGSGTLILLGANNYSGPIVVQGGTLAVSTMTTLAGPMTVLPGAALGANRSTSNGQLSVASLSLDTAGVVLDFAQQAGSRIVPLKVLGTLTNTGTTDITILNSGPMVAGTYPLIRYGSYQSNDFSAFAAVGLPPGMVGSIVNDPPSHSLVLVVSAPPSLAADMTAGRQLALSWPQEFVGWQLQRCTNSRDLMSGTNWYPIAGSVVTNVLVLPMDLAIPVAFFRLVYPPIPESVTPDPSVRTVDWTLFQAGYPGDTNAQAVTAILQNACKYAMTTWWATYYAPQDSASYINYGGIDETHIRRPGMEAYGLAVALQTGAYSPALTGVPQATALARMLKLVRSLGSSHLVNQAGGWGNDWQTANWAWYAGMAGWMFWTNLPPTDQEHLRRMVEYEANRFTNYTVPYYMNRSGTIVYPGDTKSEENAWNAELLHLAVCMMPAHSNAPAWWNKAIEMTLSTYARPSDVTRTNVYHGRTLASWLNGSNANEDSTVINHSIIHPDYLAAGLSQMQPALLYLLAGRPVPAASFFNLDVSYHAMVDLNFAAGTTPYPGGGAIRSPGGFIYLRDGSGQPTGDLYYPQGNDWGTMRRMHVATMDCVAHAFHADGLASIPGDRWEWQHDQVVLGMQARFTDGHTYGAASEDTYGLREEWLCYFAGKSLQTKWLVYQGPVRIDNGLFVSH